MGWTATHRRHGESLQDFFASQFRFAPDAPTRWRIIDSSLVRRSEFYAVAEYEAGPNVGMRFALVILVSFPRGDYNIRYKEMGETELPYAFNCPARLLGKLSPVADLYGDSEYSSKNATDWRQGCRDVAAKRRNPIKPGDTVEFAAEIGFTNGVKGTRFIYLKGSRFNHPSEPGQFRIPNWRDRDHTVTAKAA